MKANVKNKIAKARAKKGITQVNLAEKVGISLPLVRAYEQGVRDINGAHLLTLCRICKLLDVPLTSILTDLTLIKLLKSIEI